MRPIPETVALASLAALAAGCAGSPRRDERFLAFDGRGRATYARERVEESNQVLAAGLTLAAAGLVSVATGWYLTEYDRRARPSPGSLGDRTFPHFWGGVALLAFGAPIATGGAADRIAWGRALDQSRGDPWEGRLLPAQWPGPAARGPKRPAGEVLYLPAGSPVPSGAEGLAVVRVEGPADPVVARLAARAPVLRWPVRGAPEGSGATSAARGGSRGAPEDSPGPPRNMPGSP